MRARHLSHSARGNGDLVGENLNERIRDRLIGAGITDVDPGVTSGRRREQQELVIHWGDSSLAIL